MIVDLNINEQENLFYYYQNWQAGQINKIHIATCGHCTYGTGRNHNSIITRGEHGVWIGPFSSIDICRNYVTTNLGITDVLNCSCCE